MKLKKKMIVKEPRTEKIIVSGTLADGLEQYARYYEKTYQETIAMPELILEMIAAFMRSDRDFQKWLKNEEVNSQKQ